MAKASRPGFVPKALATRIVRSRPVSWLKIKAAITVPAAWAIWRLADIPATEGLVSDIGVHYTRKHKAVSTLCSAGSVIVPDLVNKV